MVTQKLRRSGTEWLPHKFGITPPTPPANRDGLIAGIHKPDASNTGPYTVSSWAEQDPSTGTSITISTPGTYYGKRYWGTVKVTAPDNTVFFRECWFAGPHPTSPTGDLTSCIQTFGSSPKKFEVWDSILDPSVWQSIRGVSPDFQTAYICGIHGGNIRVYRTEITNVQDGWNWIGPSATPAADLQQTTLQQCWIHKGYYVNDWYDARAPDGQPHCDAFQTNYGRNLLIKGNTLGGVRNITGYNIWPGGYNSGDDFWNAGLQLSQEVDDNDLHRIRNVTIEQNWIGGGTSSINHARDPDNPGAWTENCFIRDNKFLTRGSDWGVKMKGDGFGLPGYDNTTSPASGYYIIRHSSFAGMYSNNTTEETGAPVPIVNG